MKLIMKACFFYMAILCAISMTFSQGVVIFAERQPPPRLLEAAREPAATAPASQSGLHWLKAVQNRDGSWGAPSHAMAATGLAALSYLSMGITPRNPTEFDDSLAYALIYLMREYDKDCPTLQLSDEIGFAIATSAMCESYRVWENPNIKPVAEKGLRTIIDRKKIFRNQPFSSGATFSNDLAVSSWNYIALAMGARAQLLAVPGELRNVLKEEAARFTSSTNLLLKITPKWVGSEAAEADNKVWETCLSILQRTKALESLQHCPLVEEEPPTEPTPYMDDVEVDFGI